MSPSGKRVLIFEGLAALLVATACALTVYTGIAPLRLFEHDTFFLLDNGYRVLQGQVPHRDFFSAWGPLIFLIEAAGLAISGVKPAGIAYANALFGALLAAWAFAIARPRLPAVSSCVIAVFTAFLIMAPFPLGYAPVQFSYARSEE